MKITHFLFVILEQDWGVFENDEAEDQEYFRRIAALSLKKEDIRCFHTEYWEIRRETQKEKITPHCFKDGLFVWRGPTGLC